VSHVGQALRGAVAVGAVQEDGGQTPVLAVKAPGDEDPVAGQVCGSVAAQRLVQGSGVAGSGEGSGSLSIIYIPASVRASRQEDTIGKATGPFLVAGEGRVDHKEKLITSAIS